MQCKIVPNTATGDGERHPLTKRKYGLFYGHLQGVRQYDHTGLICTCTACCGYDFPGHGDNRPRSSSLPPHRHTLTDSHYRLVILIGQRRLHARYETAERLGAGIVAVDFGG